MKAFIYLCKDNNSFCIKLDLNGKKTWHDIKLDNLDADFLSRWIFAKVKPVFFSMPLDEMKILCAKSFYENHKNIIDACSTVLECTNNEISKHKELKDCGKDYSEILFFNISEDIRYKSFYERLNRKKAVFYMNMEAGFNRVTRRWEASNDLPIGIDELIKFIQTKKIRKIISINYYLLDRYMEKTGVNLIALFNYIGVEYIIINNDPLDLRTSGHIHKTAMHNNDCIQFSNLKVLNQYWDTRYDLDSNYIAIPQDYQKGEFQKLNKGFDIIVLSNSRWDSIGPNKKIIEEFLAQVPGDSLFDGFQIWYVALRYLVLNVMELTEYEKLKRNSWLHCFYFMVANYFKHLIINSLKTTRKIKVYGDIGWEKACPQYYCGSLNNEEVNRLYEEGNHLYLLLNFSFSYLDASGPVYDVMRRKVPFLNVPPMVKSPFFKHMEALEYKNFDDLNSMVKVAPKIYKAKRLQNALSKYNDILISSMVGIENRINEKAETRHPAFTFDGRLKEHQTILDQKIVDYIDKHEGFLRSSYRSLVCGQEV